MLKNKIAGQLSAQYWKHPIETRIMRGQQGRHGKAHADERPVTFRCLIGCECVVTKELHRGVSQVDKGQSVQTLLLESVPRSFQALFLALVNSR